MSAPVLTTKPSVFAISDVFGVEGAKIVSSPKFEDKRGFFKEIYNMMHTKDIPHEWAQDNLAESKANVLRGLHIQRKRPQGKLITCIHGKILDVGVDLRPKSKTFGKHAVVVMDNPNISVYWPPGIAHGYYSPWNSTIIYKCTTPYDASSDGGILWCDPELGIKWYDSDISPVVSTKDMCLPKLRDYINSLS